MTPTYARATIYQAGVDDNVRRSLPHDRPMKLCSTLAPAGRCGRRFAGRRLVPCRTRCAFGRRCSAARRRCPDPRRAAPDHCPPHLAVAGRQWGGDRGGGICVGGICECRATGFFWRCRPPWLAGLAGGAAHEDAVGSGPDGPVLGGSVRAPSWTQRPAGCARSPVLPLRRSPPFRRARR